MFSQQIFAERRRALLESMGDGVAVFFSAPVFIRNNDVEHEYRQDSDFFWLTGFDEPSSVLVLSNVHASHEAVLFLRPRDPSREIWDGPRVGVDDAVRVLGADAAFLISELAEKLPDYLSDAKRLVYRFGVEASHDEQILAAIRKVRAKQKLVVAPTEIVDTSRFVHESRLKKDASEIEAMSRASAITHEAHLAAMRVAVPGAYEYEVEAEILRTYRKHGAERAAYGSIVGSGPNATILHYRKNDRRIEKGDLLLIDAGAEFDYYASDVTRTFPVDGKFTDAQRTIYELVLQAQLAAIDVIRPGATIDDVHQCAVRVLTTGLIQLGLLSGNVDEAVEKGTYKAFYMHGTSHWLGMDVHDVGGYFSDVKVKRQFQPGYVLTVEPGIYIAQDAEVEAQFRGIGIRIEDDILVTETGSRNLTAAIPKTVADIERVLLAR